MTDLFDATARRFSHAGALIRATLVGDAPIPRATLNEAMCTAFGGSDADGRWTQRDSFEALELALAMHLAGTAAPQSADCLAPVLSLSERLPTQTVRSETQMAWHQFSTPIDLAGVATLLAAPKPDDIVLEPSAGNGLLAAQLGPVAALHLNEIDADRRDRLAIAFPTATISGHDGAVINATLADVIRPTLILMNPPFSRSLGRGDDDYAAVRHLQAALKLLAPRGRIVAIMPDWFGPTGRMRDLFHATFRDMTLRTALRLEKCYGKHGTSIAVRLFVIDKAAGALARETQQSDSVAGLLDGLRIPLRLTPTAASSAPTPVRKAVSLFGAAKVANISAAVPRKPAAHNDAVSTLR